MTDKIFLSANQLLRDSYALGARVYNDGFRPDFVVGVWRGGSPVAIAIHELLDYCGVKADHCAVRTLSYQGIDQRDGQVTVDGLDYLLAHASPASKILLVDDVHDTGLSLQALLAALRRGLGESAGPDIRLATIYYKPGRSQVDFAPDYYLHSCDDWLVFPHELIGLDRKELGTRKPGIEDVLDLLLDQS